jgi:hypothetical protein
LIFRRVNIILPFILADHCLCLRFHQIIRGEQKENIDNQYILNVLDEFETNRWQILNSGLTVKDRKLFELYLDYKDEIKKIVASND